MQTHAKLTVAERNAGGNTNTSLSLFLCLPSNFCISLQHSNYSHGNNATGPTNAAR